MTPITLYIPANHLSALLKIAGKKDVRWYLNGIYFDPRGFLVAIDGSALMAVHCEPFTGEGFIVPRKVVELAVKSIPVRKRAVRHLRIDYQPGETGQVGRGEIVGDHDCFGFTGIDGQYPQWQNVVPKSVSGEPAEYMTPLLTTARAAYIEYKGLTGKAALNEHLHIAVNGRGCGLAQTITGCCIVIMPVKMPRMFAPNEAAEHVAAFIERREPRPVDTVNRQSSPLEGN